MQAKKWSLILLITLIFCWTLGEAMSWAADLRYIVTFREGTPIAVEEEIVEESGSTIINWIALLNAVVITLPVDQAEEALNFLRNQPEVEVIEHDFSIATQRLKGIQGTFITPTDAEPAESGYTWNLLQIYFDEVKENVQKRGGKGVKIAVLDTGIDPTHPDLADAVSGGYNARAGEDENDYRDYNGHGTHIAGIIAAAAGQPNEWRVMRGIAPKVELYTVRVLADDGGGYLSDLINGLSWVYNHPEIRVVNMSLGFYEGSSLLHKVVKLLHESGVVIVASAGNYETKVQQGEGGSGEGGSGEGGSGEGGSGEGGSGEGGSGEGGSGVTVIKCIPAGEGGSGEGGSGEGGSGEGGSGEGGSGEGGSGEGGSGEGGSGEGGSGEGGSGEGGSGEGGSGGSGCIKLEVNYPAKYPETIAVAATDIDAKITYYSIEGPEVDIAAPGGTRLYPVISTTITPSEDGHILVAAGEGGSGEGGSGEGGSGEILYGWGSGTSQAAAHITGVVALMLSVNPSLDPDSVREILQKTALDLGAAWEAQGAGLVDAAYAVKKAATEKKKHKEKK